MKIENGEAKMDVHRSTNRQTSIFHLLSSIFDFDKSRAKVLATLLMILASTQVQALTVEEAYQAIPHARTEFDADAADMPSEEKEFLKEFFGLIDSAIVLRVEIWQSGGNKETAAKLLSNYAEIEKNLLSLTVPAKLQSTHSLVMEAIREQKDFLAEWIERLPSNINAAENPKVRRASSRLHEAYGQLMKRYPNEAAHNKEAFFNYLCALDFI